MLFTTYGIDCFELVLWLIEYGSHVLVVWFGITVAIVLCSNGNGQSKKPKSKLRLCRKAATVFFLFPLLIVLLLTTGTFLASWEQAYLDGYDLFAPSLRSQAEHYIATGQGDLQDILESGKYAPKMGWIELKYLLKDLLLHTLVHKDSHNADNIKEGYNKGNDWFESTLGKETMVYTSGFYYHDHESLTEAQHNKIDHVANVLQLQPGDQVLDIGCGWGYLAKRLTETYGAKVTGVTLSSDQLAWGTAWNKDNGAHILLQDAMRLGDRTDLLPPGGFDKITSLEMAEHVGIRRYQEFLTTVHGLLKDDGVFYFQVAGLRRDWKFEDFVWGLFMGEHVFPGADASCPLGWVGTQLERAGFEIQTVHNLGTHYSRTLAHWLENFRGNKEHIVATYGPTAFRRWEVFLAWSVRIARQGSSTLFTFTLTKAHQEPRRIETQQHVVPGRNNRNSNNSNNECQNEVMDAPAAPVETVQI